MTPTAEDLARDLALCEAPPPPTWHAALDFITAARAGWPAAIRRALAAEALLRRACNATGVGGYAELTAALDEARALLGIPRPWRATQATPRATRAAGEAAAADEAS